MPSKGSLVLIVVKFSEEILITGLDQIKKKIIGDLGKNVCLEQ